MPVSPFHTLFTITLACLAGYFVASSATAQNSSRAEQKSTMRLIGAAATPDDGVWRAGIEISLRPGWKTYWRYAGNSGIAPRFDFSASKNVKNVEVLWPAPMRFSDGSGTSIGYAERVVLPLRVTPQSSDAHPVLHLKLDYAICEKLCVPMTDEAELPLDRSDRADAALLRSYEARVPRRQALGASSGLAVLRIVQQPLPKPHVVIDVRAAGSVDLFAEGPDEKWSLPLPQPVAGAPAGVQRFVFEVDGLPPGQKAAGGQVTLTAISPEDAVETVFHLD